MNLQDYIKKENIFIGVKPKSKHDVIREIIKKSSINEDIKDYVYEKVLEREELEPTAVGNGIGIAHAKVEIVDDIEILMGIIKEGIDYEAFDDTPVKILFVVIAPVERTKDYLNVMAKISRVCRNRENVDKIVNFDTPEKILEIVKEV
jgi:PTS system fructose-specific IIC component